MSLSDPAFRRTAKNLQQELSMRSSGRRAELDHTARQMSFLTSERRMYEFFLCEVGVGKGYPVEDEAAANGERFTCPAGFDSAYIKHPTTLAPTETLALHLAPDNIHNPCGSPGNQPTSTGTGGTPSLGVLPQHTFRHDYVVYDSSQVVPRYLVQFECDPTLPELFAVPLCDYCQEASATLWCSADSARLCLECDNAMHTHNKIVTRHIRVPLNEASRSFGKCLQHPDDTYELFCTVCRVPVCRLCRPSHLHRSSVGSNEPGSTLIDLGVGYRGALQTCKEPHAVLNRRKKRLLEKLEEVQSLLDDVRANCLEGEQRIFALAEQATNELQVLTEEKMSILLSDQLEAARQLSQIEWSKQFVKYSQSILPPADFLMAWLRHCRVREEFELLSLNTCKLGEGVVADMRLEGRVDILTGE
eukprot:GHVN01018498.1.p1 GENE.GHVN01018498.1~~GHVN01018498.1.p1  ORF type:complete len:461 (-),score=52.87 GHVN01018498.1:108-1358(-)